MLTNTQARIIDAITQCSEVVLELTRDVPEPDVQARIASIRLAAGIAGVAAAIDGLEIERQIRDVLRMIDHRLSDASIQAHRDPIGYRIAGLIMAKGIVEAADDRLAALGDIEQTIAELRSQIGTGT